MRDTPMTRHENLQRRTMETRPTLSACAQCVAIHIHASISARARQALHGIFGRPFT